MSKESSQPEGASRWYSDIRMSLRAIDPTMIMNRSAYPWLDDDPPYTAPKARIVRQAPEGGEVIIRTMSPDTDLLMDNEELASSINVLDDAAVAILLLVGHAGLNTEPKITRRLNQFSENGHSIISPSSSKKNLRALVKAGILQREERKGIEPGDRKKQVTFSISPGDTTSLAQAGHLAELSVHHDSTLTGVFGQTESSHGEARYFNDKVSYTMDRIRIIRMLNDARRQNGAHNPLPVTATYIANELGISYQRAAAHLRCLAEAGALDAESVDTAKGSYQRYKRDPEVNLGRTSSPLQRTLLEFMDSQPEGASTYLASVYALSLAPQEQRELSVDEWRIHFDSVRKAIYHLSSRGVLVPTTLMNRDIKMVLRFRPLTRQLSLIRDAVISLFQVQREDPNALEEGLRFGNKIALNEDKVAILARKISQANERYRSKALFPRNAVLIDTSDSEPEASL